MVLVFLKYFFFLNICRFFKVNFCGFKVVFGWKESFIYDDLVCDVFL